MRTGISFTVSTADRARLEAIVPELHMSSLPAEALTRLINDYSRHVVIGIARSPEDGKAGETEEQRSFQPELSPLYSILDGFLAKDDPNVIYALELDDRLVALVHLGGRETRVGERIQELRALSDVAWADRNPRIGFLEVRTGDPLRPLQWALDQIEAPAAWSRLDERAPTRTELVKIAIVDWGAFAQHEDLKGARLNGVSVLPNGHSWDDDDGHGTLLAGTIAAVANSVGITGMAQATEILAVKFVDARTTPTAAFAAAAVYVAVYAGAKVINASWDIGIDDSEILRDAIRFAGTRGVTFVAAAGNSGRDNTRDPVVPATYGFPNVISVMASDPNGDKPSFSNFGDNVDLAAPGLNIVSTHPYLLTPGSMRQQRVNIAYRYYTGTSAAAAHVTGAIALLLQLDPGLSPSEIRDHLIASATPVPELADKCRAGGYLNLNRAVCGPFVVTRPRGGERLRRATLCEVEWRSEYETELVGKRLMSVYDLDNAKIVGKSVEVGASGRMRFELPEMGVRRAVIRLASDPHRFYSDSAIFSVI